MDTAVILQILLVAAGVVTLFLGVTHFYFPALLSYRQIFDAYPHKDPTLPDFRLVGLRYPWDVHKAYGFIWMMNHHVSFVLTSIGVLEIGWSGWMLRDGHILAWWIAAFWLLRIICQPVLLGRKWYDWLIASGFVALCAGHVWIALRS
jgi:hypothetical protein